MAGIGSGLKMNRVESGTKVFLKTLNGVFLPTRFSKRYIYF
jgi:hypothetical protein